MQASSLIQYLPQHGPLSSEFIPGEVELPEHWMAKFLPFNFLGVPTWGNSQLTLNVQRDFLLTALNMSFTTTFPGGQVVSAVAVTTAGAGQTPGVYNINGVGGGGTGASIAVTVNGDGTVHAGGVAILNRGTGYATAPTFTMPGGAGGAPPATLTATISASGLAPQTGQPTLQIYQNHRRVQLQLMQKSLLATGVFGTGSQPGYLKRPYLFAKNDQITVECSYTSVFPGYAGASNTEPNYLYCYLTLVGGEPRA